MFSLIRKTIKRDLNFFHVETWDMEDRDNGTWKKATTGPAV